MSRQCENGKIRKFANACGYEQEHHLKNYGDESKCIIVAY